MNQMVAVSIGALLVVATTALMVRASPRVRDRVIGIHGGRMPALDGLRGVLVLSVMLHHGFLTRSMSFPGDWPTDQSGFVWQLGSAAVALFFMISAFLFGGRLLDDDGRVNVARLAIGRIMRIAPMYVVAIGLFLAITLIHSGGLVVPLGKLMRSAGRVLLFDFVPVYDVNGFPDRLRAIGQIWTLRWEWLFYLCLPVMGFAVRRLGGAWAAYALLALVAIGYSPLFWLFAAGLAVSRLVSIRRPWIGIAWQVGAIIGVLILVTQFTMSDDWPQALLLIPTLAAVVRGDGAFALLGRAPMRFLGEISYSFYLLHGIVLYFASEWIVGLAAFRELGTIGFALVMAGVGIATAIVSTCTFLVVERPAMRPFHSFAMRRA